MEMANFKPLQMQLLEDVLQMGGGFVLKFSDRTFAEFFRDELAVDIDDPKYSVGVSGCSTRFSCSLLAISEDGGMWQCAAVVHVQKVDPPNATRRFSSR